MTEQAIADNPAGSAPATEAVVEPKQFHEFTAQERSEYLKTLKTPDPPKTEESAPQQTAEPEKAESAPESAPEPPQEKAKGKPKGTGTPEEKRIPQLLSERNALEKRVAELEKQLKEGAAPTKAEPAPQPKPGLEAPKKPKWEEFQAQGKTYEEYDAAKDEYFEKLAEFKSKMAVEEDRKARAQAEVDRTVAERLASAEKLYPDYREVAAPAMERLGAEAHPLVKEMLSSSEYLAHMLYVMGKDAGELASFLGMAKSNPFAAMRKIAIYEQLIKEELTKPKGEAKAESEAEPPKPESSKPAKKVTSVPPPLEEVGGKVTKAPDPLAEALAAGDVGAYRRELNRQRRMSARG